MALDYEAFMPLVKRVASSVSKNFPPYVQSSDTEGALYVWLFQKKDWIETTVRDSPKNWEPKISSLMRKVAFDHCNKEKAAAEGYDTSDIYRYSIPKIKTLLSDVFDYADWQSFGLHGDGQPGAKPQANTTGDRVAELVDIKIALNSLKDETYNLLVWQYKYHYTMDGLAEELEISPEAASKRAQRALTALQKRLGYKPPVDQDRALNRRTVRSNAAAQAAVSHQWEG